MRELEQFLQRFEAESTTTDRQGARLLPASLQREVQRLQLKVEASRKKVRKNHL